MSSNTTETATEDEEIQSLIDLRSSVKLAYTMTSCLPAMTRQNIVKTVAAHLAKLVTEIRLDLYRRLERSEHWIESNGPVFIPTPLANVEYPTACDGAYQLLFTLAMLASVESGAGDDQPLPEDANQLAESLAAKWQSGMPDWLLAAPVSEYQRLAELAKDEVNAAITKATLALRTSKSTTASNPVPALVVRVNADNPGVCVFSNPSESEFIPTSR